MTLTLEQIAHIKSMEDDAGRLTPAQIVADARQKSSPLHNLFDWDKARAAEQYWLDCAREVIRTVRIEITTTTAVVRAPYYLRDPDAVGQGYRAVEALQRSPTAARQAMIEELNRAAGSIRRAREVALSLGLDDDVDALLGQIVGLRGRLEEEQPPVAMVS